MARTVEDAVRVFEVMVGLDPADPLTQILHNVRQAAGQGCPAGLAEASSSQPQ